MQNYALLSGKQIIKTDELQPCKIKKLIFTNGIFKTKLFYEIKLDYQKPCLWNLVCLFLIKPFIFLAETNWIKF